MVSADGRGRLSAENYPGSGCERKYFCPFGDRVYEIQCRGGSGRTYPGTAEHSGKRGGRQKRCGRRKGGSHTDGLGNAGETNVSRKTDIPVKHMAQVILENTEIEDNTGEEENKFDQERYEKEWEDSMVSDVEEIKAGGFLKLVLPRGSALSGEAIETEDLPSGQIPEGEPLTFQNGLDDLGREVLYNVYLTEYFPSFVTEEKRNVPSMNWNTFYLERTVMKPI